MSFTLAHYVSKENSVYKFFRGLTSLRGETFEYVQITEPENGDPPNAIAKFWASSRYSSMELGWTTTARHCFLDANGKRIKTADDIKEFSERVDMWLDSIA